MGFYNQRYKLVHEFLKLSSDELKYYDNIVFMKIYEKARANNHDPKLHMCVPCKI
jgi:hypothetical protein